MEISGAMNSILLEVVISYKWVEHTEEDTIHAGVTDVGDLQVFVTVSYRYLEPSEDTMSVSATATSIVIETILIVYENYTEDELSVSATMLGIDLV